MRTPDPIQTWLSTEAIKWATPATKDKLNRLYNHRQRVKSVAVKTSKAS